MKRPINYIVAIVVVSWLLASPALASVAVYTDRQDWENALLAIRPRAHFHDQDFEEELPGLLATGLNYFPPLLVDIPGTPGDNAIDNSFTNDPYFDALSPNGSTYYLGDVNTQASDPPVLIFSDLEFAVAGFGADWIVDGGLVMEVQGTQIPFNTYLPTGSGFLGVTTTVSRRYYSLDAYLSGSAVFGMDDIRTGNIVPEPSTTGLAFLAWLIVCAFRRRP